MDGNETGNFIVTHWMGGAVHHKSSSAPGIAQTI
jgi:hypothetical protein